MMEKAAHEVWETSQKQKINLKEAAFAVALEKIANGYI
jgi:glutamate dehydrogenase/leucine dehydrogenase